MTPCFDWSEKTLFWGGLTKPFKNRGKMAGFFTCSVESHLLIYDPYNGLLYSLELGNPSPIYPKQPGFSFFFITQLSQSHIC